MEPACASSEWTRREPYWFLMITRRGLCEGGSAFAPQECFTAVVAMITYHRRERPNKRITAVLSCSLTARVRKNPTMALVKFWKVLALGVAGFCVAIGASAYISGSRSTHP